MYCLILGGAGFIGSSVAYHLSSAGHRVRILDIRPSSPLTNPFQAEYICSDWTDLSQLKRALTGTEIVIHLVGTTIPATSNDQIVQDISENLIPTVNLLQMCVEIGIHKVIFSSSGGTVYGRARYLPIDEDHPTHPISSYGILKLAIEKYLHLFSQLHGLNYISLRGANPYGIGQDPSKGQGVINVFLSRLARAETIEIFGDGQVVRDYFYIDDLGRAFQVAVESEITEGIFNVGSGQGKSLVELVKEITAITGIEPRVQYRPSRGCDVPVNILNISRIRTQLGWQPIIPLTEGIRRTWEWIQSNSGQTNR